MRVLVLLVVCLGAANAFTKRQTTQALPADAQLSFTNTFRQAVYFKVVEAYNTALTVKSALDADTEQCNVTIGVAQAACEAEIKSTCAPDLWDMALYYLDVGVDEVESFFVDTVWGSTLGTFDWDGFETFFTDDVTNFFSGETWAGFGDQLESWAIDFGNMFLGWGIDAGEWFISLFRKRRSIGSSMSTKEEMSKLIDMMRSLRKQRPNQERRTQVKVAALSRRELSGDERDCMERCPSCDPFLGDTEYLLSQLCAAYDLLTRQAALNATVNKIMWVADVANDTVNFMVVQTENGGAYDYATVTLAETYITAVFKSGNQRYLSAEKYQLMDSGATAAACGNEYWDTKYDLYDTV